MNDQKKYLIGIYKDMKIALEEITELYEEADNEAKDYLSKLNSAVKEMHEINEEYELLKSYVSKEEKEREMIDKLKEDIHYLEAVYTKNMSTISRLKNETLCNSELFDSSIGFDSVTTTSKSENKSYRSLYYEILEKSAENKKRINSVLNTDFEMQSAIRTAVNNLHLITDEINGTVKSVQTELGQLFLGDREVFNNLIKRRRDLEKEKLNNECRLNILVSEIKEMGKRTKVKDKPDVLSGHTNYSARQLKKFTFGQLMQLWKTILMQWPHQLPNKEP